MSGFSKQSFSDLLLSLSFIIFIYSCFRRKWFRENRSFENYHEIYRCSNESDLEIGYRRVRCDYAHYYLSRIKCLLELNMIRTRFCPHVSFYTPENREKLEAGVMKWINELSRLYRKTLNSFRSPENVVTVF